MEIRLDGKRALVTGASRGIGAAVAHQFAAAGADLIIAARSGPELEDVRKSIIQAHHATVEIHAGDLSDDAAPRIMSERFQNVDILVNNAGAIPTGGLTEVAMDDWRAGWNLKVFGYIGLTQAFYRSMQTRGGGAIINIIGSSGEWLDPRYVCGSTGNAALMAFTKCVGKSSLDDGVRVLGINPGPVDSTRLEKYLRSLAAREPGAAFDLEKLVAGLPGGRAASVKEIAEIAVFLASDSCAYLSGSIVTVDGGFTGTLKAAGGGSVGT